MNDQQAVRHAWPPAQVVALTSGDDDPHRRGYDGAPSGGRELIRVLRRRLGLLVVWTALCIGGASLYLYQAAPEFVATAQVVLESRRSLGGSVDLAIASYGATLDSAQADSQVQVVKSERTLRYVFDALDLADDPAFAHPEPSLLARVMALLPVRGVAREPRPAEAAATTRARAFQAFADRIAVRRLGLSYVLEISFRAPTAAQAARLANAVTAAYIRDSIIYGAAAAQRGTEILQGRIADIQSQQDLAAEAVRKGVLPDAPFPDSDARIVSVALEPLGKAYPQSSLILLLAAAFGLISGSGTVLARHALDRTVRTRQQIGQALGIDRISLVPRFQRSTRNARRTLAYDSVIDDNRSAFAEALRVLRTSILASRTASKQMAIGVVSWSAGEGRTAIASNLAMLVAASREGVVLLDADFRNPALTRALAPDAATGLDDALITPGSIGTRLVIPLGPNLDFVPAVAHGGESNPNVFIGSAEMARFLGLLREQRDIIVDLPPLGVSSDTQAIAHLLDGVILVVKANRTSIDDMTEACRILQRAGVPVLRVVLNNALGSRRSESATQGGA